MTNTEKDPRHTGSDYLDGYAAALEHVLVIAGIWAEDSPQHQIDAVKLACRDALATMPEATR